MMPNQWPGQPMQTAPVFQDPYRARLGSMQTFQPPRYEIIRVNGENGARAFQMAPNSTALLLDDTAPIVWFVQTDGAGYKTETPFSISPYQPTPPVDVNALEARIQRLEAMIHEPNPTAFAETAPSGPADPAGRE